MEIKATVAVVVATLGVLSFPAWCRLSDDETTHQFTAAPLLVAEGMKAVVESDHVARQHGVDTIFFGRNESKSCRTWRYIPENSSKCKCGNPVGNDIQCVGTNKSVKVLRCYCITYDNNNRSLVVGACLYSCLKGGYQSYYEVDSDPTELDQKMCAKYSRTGQLCGECIDNFALPVYSYNLSCVNCTGYRNNWLKFILVSFVPLTGFYFIIIMCRISVTSGLMNAFLLIAQILTLPLLMRGLVQMHDHRSQLPLIILSSIFGIWNLDFFRLVYPSFCLHPKMTMLQVMALDYVIAVYPLALIVVTYTLVELHDYFRILNWFWRPFNWLFGRIRRQWNIRDSLIEAFATFLLLSYVKFLNVSFDILNPMRVYNVTGHRVGIYVFYDGTLQYLGPKHLPYAILAFVVLLIFNIFPIVLLSVYPCRCFQRLLARCNLRSHALHIFMDAFQGCYKNGTNGTSDCRWFSTVYLWVRLLFLIIGSITYTDICLTIGATISLFVALMISVVQPYKSRAYNIVDTALIHILAFMFVAGTANAIAYSINIQFKGIANTMIGVSFLMPLVYFVGLIVYKLFSRSQWAHVCEKIRLCLLCICKSKQLARADLEGSLPDRITHPEEYVAMFSESDGSDDRESNYPMPTERTFLLGP